MNRAQRRKSGNRKPVNFNKAQIDEAKMQAYQQAADFAFKMMIWICELEGKPIRDLIMCPRDVPLTQKFICDEDCVYCGEE